MTTNIPAPAATDAAFDALLKSTANAANADGFNFSWAHGDSPGHSPMIYAHEFFDNGDSLIVAEDYTTIAPSRPILFSLIRARLALDPSEPMHVDWSDDSHDAVLRDGLVAEDTKAFLSNLHAVKVVFG